MSERTRTGKNEIVNPNLRLARFYDSKNRPHVKEYSPSGTEELLEEVCRSFHTELGQAEINPINGTKLVRVARPIVVANQYTHEESLLAFQYTRFSPFYGDSSKLVEMYKANVQVPHNKSFEKIMEDIERSVKERQGGEWNPFEEVTDSAYIPDVHLARWRKALYFSVFKLDNDGVPQQQVKPFTIHEGGSFANRPPDIHITFQRAPLFFDGNRVENDKGLTDYLTVDFPRIRQEHNAALQTAFSLHPLDKIGQGTAPSSNEVTFKITSDGIKQTMYDIPSSTPREQTMGFIQAYLRKVCSGSTL